MNKHAYERETAALKKAKFFNHLKIYLCLVGFMLGVKIFLGSDANFYPVAFWWGFGVVVHYLRTFGFGELVQPPANPTYRHQQEVPDEPEAEEIVQLPLKQPQKAWRDRDLV